MKNLVEFLVNISRLKTMPRTGWVWLGVKNPETIAEHTFRTALMVWLLGSHTRLNVTRMIEIALLHDICEVYAGDITPYHGILPKDPRKRLAMLYRWVRLPRSEKASLARRKFAIEKKSLLELIKPLAPRVREGIVSLWLDFERGISREGKFVRQVDRIEALLQGIEYFGVRPNTPVVGWWEGLEELVVDPFLKKFLKAVDQHFYRKKRTQLDPLLNFLMLLGKLKRRPRPDGVLRRVRDPVSFASHSFMLTIMAWLFAREWMLRLNIGHVLKTALLHHLAEASLEAQNPYDALLRGTGSEREQRRVLNRWVRSTLIEKQSAFRRQVRERNATVTKLIAPLGLPLRNELRRLYREFTEGRSREAQFLIQTSITELLLQALQYRAADRRFPIAPWWEWAYESTDSSLHHQFMEALKNKFHRGVK